MVIIWGSNFSVVKVALVDFPEIAFNAMRMVVGSIVFLAAIWWTGQKTKLSRADWVRLVCLGVIGHFVYQLCFVGGLKRTSVGNSSLIVGASPVLIAVLSSFAGHERVPALRWLGVALAMLGLYFVVGHRAAWSATSRLGDLLVIASMLCWATYSVAAQPLLKKHSPLAVTGVSFAIGSALYLLATLPVLAAVEWSAISRGSWMLMVASAVFALNLAYLIWYTGVQQLGGTRTAVYSYLTPIVAMIVAATWLGEPISGNQVIGACGILTGLVVTRFAR
jgi:drug/metabolite transporter (DMT)-like permease